MKRTLVLLLGVAALAACSRPTPEMETVSERFAPIRDHFSRMNCERAKKESTDPAVRARDCRPRPPVNPNLRKTPLYCYRTWAEPDCYIEPLPAEADSRLMGVLMPATGVIQPVATMQEAQVIVTHETIQSNDLAPPSGSYVPPPSYTPSTGAPGPRMLMPR